ncbi:MAG TPA: fasciclin domain-containing protein [Longimicrobiales bacterium]|nr:fasciclin domain-containing protein [Longimicrobiales bacterium]
MPVLHGCGRITMSGGNAYINDARIVATDIEASNGIIHVIDEVLLP